jgi:hypothetical protein
MADPVFNISLEFDAGVWTEVTDDVKTVDIFRTVGNAITPLAPGECSLVLDNWSRNYSPDYGSGTYAGKILPGMRMRMQATHSGSTYGVFVGFLDEAIVSPVNFDRVATYRFRDDFRHLSDRTITTSMFIGFKSESVAVAILSETAVQSFTVAVLGDTFPFASFERRDAINAMQQVLESGFYSAYVTPEGQARIEDRYVGQTNNPEVTISNDYNTFDYLLSDAQVYNNISVQGEQRRAVTDQATLSWIETPLTVPASGWAAFFLNYLDPHNFEPTPAQSLTVVSSADFLANAASDGSGVDHTATTSVAMTFFGRSAKAIVTNNTADDVFLHKFQVRGYHVERVANVAATSDDTSSQNVYGERGMAFDSNLIADPNFISDYADFLLDRQKNPIAANTFSIKNQWPTQLGLDLTDNIDLVESETGTDGTFVIIGIEHVITTGDSWQHETRYTVDKFRDQEVLLLDDGSHNELLMATLFGESEWVKSATSVTSDAATVPTDATSALAWKLFDSTANQEHVMFQDIASLQGLNDYYASGFVAPDEYDAVRIGVKTQQGSLEYVDFQIASRAILASTASATGTITSASATFARASVQANVSSGGVTPGMYLYPMINNSLTSYTGQGSSGIIVIATQIQREGLGAYVETTSASASTGFGVLDVRRLGL